MNSWPIPSRMPSNLCYKEGHPSHRQAAVLYTTAQTQKHTAHMLGSLTKGLSDHSQGLLCITQKTLLHPQVWRDVPLDHFKVQECAAFHPHLHQSVCFFGSISYFYLKGV